MSKRSSSVWEVDFGNTSPAELCTYPARPNGLANQTQSIGGGDSGTDSSAVDAGEANAIISAEKQLEAKKRQVMALATSPGKSLFTTAFMLWMSGSSIQIFSIMMTGMALINPLKAILTTNTVFRPFSDSEVDVKLPKLIFVGLQVLSLAVALYKCSTMGLLPLTSGDWTAYIPLKTIAEVAACKL